uniref:Uncharacterized mitochondrial protein AtMg00810-like n=1 Tax=Tanacetum cinerariifolium TaxID=118510 RepID=A0A6L2JYF2_TANCI|nr:uncharacterized mitochondrial protein AtMg00810-like [Tanacetum cinerariifolium]
MNSSNSNSIKMTFNPNMILSCQLLFGQKQLVLHAMCKIELKPLEYLIVEQGPDWLFDIDTLTRTINYEPVIAGIQSNGFAGTKASDNASQAKKETEPIKDYIFLPLWTADPPFSQDPESSHNDGSKPLSDDGKKVDEDLRKKVNVKIKRMKIMLTALTINDEDDGTVADMNNLDTTIQMSSMGELTFFLGLQVKQKKDGTFISQDKYVAKTLNKFWFTKVKTASTPMETQKPLFKDEDGEEVDVHMYRDLQLADEEGINCLANSAIFEQLALMGKPTKKDTQVPQPSGLTESVTDEAVHKELGDSLVRAATTASSLGAKQDSGNITKTQSKVTPNDSSSQETNSAGGPRCQETIGDTTAQTRFESVSKHSNDSLLARGNTHQSEVDRMKLDELMELCTNLQNKVLDLEQTKTTQKGKIASLKRMVKKLERRNRSRTHKLNRLYKVGLSDRVESSGDEERLGEDASKQERRIDTIDADEDITLVNDADKEMFDVDDLGDEEVFVAGKNENVVEEVVNVAQVSTAATTVTVTTEEITLAQALTELKTSKPKVKGIVFQETSKTTTTISLQQSLGKSKGIMIEEPVKPKKKDQIRLDEEADKKLQAEFDKEERLAREKSKKEERANIALIETLDDIQAKIDADHQLAERLQEQE